MITAGITGSIGSGKTLVCSILSKLGARIFNADEESKRLLDQHPLLKEKISSTFGKSLYNPTGLDKALFAELIFKDPERLRTANSIIHPFVHEAFEAWALAQDQAKVVFMEAAILFESGSWKKFDHLILVYAPEAVRMERVMARNQVSAQQVRERMKHQMPDCDKIKLAHYLINNDGDTPLLPQVLCIWEELNK